MIFGAVMEGQKPPAQKALEAENHAKTIHRISVGQAVVKGLRAASRNPDSVKIDTMRVNEDGTIACAEYRAQNGFGGTNRAFAIVREGKFAFSDTPLWNKVCLASMVDVTALLAE